MMVVGRCKAEMKVGKPMRALSVLVLSVVQDGSRPQPTLFASVTLHAN